MKFDCTGLWKGMMDTMEQIACMDNLDVFRFLMDTIIYLAWIHKNTISVFKRLTFRSSSAISLLSKAELLQTLLQTIPDLFRGVVIEVIAGFASGSLDCVPNIILLVAAGSVRGAVRVRTA